MPVDSNGKEVFFRLTALATDYIFEQSRLRAYHHNVDDFRKKKACLSRG